MNSIDCHCISGFVALLVGVENALLAIFVGCLPEAAACSCVDKGQRVLMKLYLYLQVQEFNK